MLIKRALWPPQQKPGPGSEVDWGHPLSRGLVGCWLFNEGAGKTLIDLVARHNAPLTGNVSDSPPRWVPGGLYWDGDTSRSQANVPYAADLNPPRITVECLATTDSLAAGYRYMVNTTYATNYGWGLCRYATTFIFSSYTDGTPANRLPGINLPSLQLGVEFDIVGSFDGAYARCFWNGRQVDQQAQTGRSLDAGQVLSFGTYNRGAAYYWIGKIKKVCLYARALTPDEVRWLHAEPYAMIRPAGPPRRYFTVSSLDQVFRLSRPGPRYTLRPLGPRYQMTALGPRYAVKEKRR